jgi:hypothetical protein
LAKIYFFTNTISAVHSKAFISPTITTESVADALIGAAAASVDAARANGGAGPGGGHDGDHGCGARSFKKKRVVWR